MSTLIFAFDVEARGRSVIRHGILAVGLIVMRSSDELVVLKKVWNVAPLPGQDFEEECVKGFWSKFPETQRELMRSPVSPQDFVQEFRGLLNQFEDQNLFLLCDNPSFDAAFINYYLDYFGLDSMSHDSRGGYARVVHDADSYTRGWLRNKPGTNVWVSNDKIAKELGITGVIESSKHMPDDDALAMVQFHVKLSSNLQSPR